MKKFIIIPTYNEKENLPELVEQIFGLGIRDLNIIVVDDNSPDGTGKIADELSQKFPLTVIHRTGKLGLGSAYIEGFKKAFESDTDIVFEMDADGSHNPKDIPQMIRGIENGYEIVIGSRKIKGGKIVGWGWYRHFASNGAMWFARIILWMKTRDITAGFRCFRVEKLKQLDLGQIKSNGYAFQEELIYWCEKKGFKIKEIPVVFNDRRVGKSKLGIKDIVEFFVNILKLRMRNF